jgi:hypothetical protein
MEETSHVKFEKLGDNNYVTWSYRMQWSLELRGLWDVVESGPSGTSATAKKSDRQAKALIGLSVEDRLVPYVTDAASAQDAWDALEEVFKASSNARGMQLTKELTELNMRDGEALTSYAGRAKSLWDQLGAIGEVISERQMVMSLLNGLPKEYTNTVQNILSTSRTLEFNGVVSKLMLVERPHGSNPDMALYTHVAKMEDKECWYCHKKGHLKADCKKRKRDQRSPGTSPIALTAQPYVL